MSPFISTDNFSGFFCSIHHVGDDLWDYHSNLIYASVAEVLRISHLSESLKKENQFHGTLHELFGQTEASFLHNGICTGVI